MLTLDLLPLLMCPVCRYGTLNTADGEGESPIHDSKLTCSACHETFEVRHGIPELVPRPERKVDQWEVWERHLEGFRSRVEGHSTRPDIRQFSVWKAKARAFAEFIGPRTGYLLDVGCGPGKFRHSLGEDRIEYVGLDPLPMPESEGFRFVQALAEKIPFQDGTFDCVVVRSALDHFCELDVSFRELARVLKPDGSLFIEQVVHEVRGPISALKTAAHELKDFVDNQRTRAARQGAPKHIRSFTARRLEKAVRPTFRIERMKRYEPRWYLPTQLMMELKKA